MILFQFFLGLTGFFTLSLMYFSLVVCEYAFIRISVSCFKPFLVEKLKKDKTLGPFFSQSSNQLLWIMRLGMLLLTFLSILFLFLSIISIFPETIFSRLIVLLIAFLLTVYFHFLCGEFWVKGWASAFPLKGFRLCAWVALFVMRLTKPLLSIFLPFAHFGSRVFKINLSHAFFSFRLEEERMKFEKVLPVSSHLLHNIFGRALEIQNLTIQNILLPRNQVKYLDLNNDNEQNIRLARECQHTRFPLCKSDLDNCVGIIHIKDLFNQMGEEEENRINLMSIRRKVLRVSPTARLDIVLEQFLVSRSHIALVVDEFGGTVGIVTLESILEEIVGDIHDEFDGEEVLLKSMGNNKFEISGLIPLHDLEDKLGAVFENEDNVSTLGGLITSKLGRIPKLKEKVILGRFTFIVTEVDDTRVITVQVIDSYKSVMSRETTSS